MFVYGLCVEGISRVRPYLPFRPFRVAEFVGDVVVRAFGSLLAKAVDDGHFFGDEPFGLGLAGGGAE